MNKKDLITFYNVAKEIQKRSTCIRVKVAALIIKNGRIISMGWNGTPSGTQHCEEYFSKITDTFLEDHHKFAVENEIHAEQNAIAFAARNGIGTDNTEMICTLSPCLSCAKLIIAAGIKKLYYIEKYDREEGIVAIEKLQNNKIEVFDISNIK